MIMFAPCNDKQSKAKDSYLCRLKDITNNKRLNSPPIGGLGV